MTEIVYARDERFLDTFGRAQYQGVTRDHYVEVEIGQEAPVDQPKFLVCNSSPPNCDIADFQLLTQRIFTSPEMAEYIALDGTAQRWYDLEGFHTRYGEVGRG